jgi:hypothetical protein
MRIRISPSQNNGSDCPRTANSRPAKSSAVPRCTAEYTPIGNAIAMLIRIATQPSCRLAGKREASTSVTGRR